MYAAVKTHNDYVRYTDGIRVWYRAVLEAYPRLRVSRTQFKRASQAQRHRYRVLGRLKRGRRHAVRPPC